MSHTIESVLDRLEPVTSETIREWSSGSAKRRLQPEDQRDDWRNVSGTIWDQHLFGSVNDWECACGKFKGHVNAKIVCNVCGVRVVSNVARKMRFGHINLSASIPHPFFAQTEPLDAIPIVPACFWETIHGAPLAKAYEEVLRCSLSKLPAEDIMGACGTVFANLERLFEEELGPDTQAAIRLVRGMAMRERQSETAERAARETAENQTETDDDANDDAQDAPDWDNLKLAPLDDEQ